MSSGTVSDGSGSYNRGSTHSRARAPSVQSQESPPNPADLRDTIARMATGPAATRIEIPRWVQLVGLPLLLVFVWVVAGAVRHAVFLFLVALLIALLLNPLVRGLGRVWIPRGLAVAIVYLAFAAALALAVLALATVVVQQTRDASHRVDNYFTVVSGQTQETGANHDLARLQHWLNAHHLKQVHVEKSGKKFLNSIGTKDVEKYTTKALNWAEGAGSPSCAALQRAARRRRVHLHAARHAATRSSGRPALPAAPGSKPLIERMEQALASYVKGQLLLSLIIGASSGHRRVDPRA